jgi:hypothetical protein
MKSGKPWPENSLQKKNAKKPEKTALYFIAEIL